MNYDIRIQIRFLAAQMAEMLIDTYGWNMKRALDELYASETFRKICDPECGLYYQGAVYNFESLQNEIERGSMFRDKRNH